MYKIGDKVLVVDAQSFINEMQNMIGKICTISNGSSDSWVLEECPRFLWLNKWLMPVINIETVAEDDILSVIGE